MPSDSSTVSPFEDVKEIVESERKRILIRLCTLWPDRFMFLAPFITELETHLESFPIHVESGTFDGFKLFPNLFEWMKAWLEGRTYPSWNLPEGSLLAGLSEQQLYLVLVLRELHYFCYYLSGEALARA
jgi:hypothetical protein